MFNAFIQQQRDRQRPATTGRVYHNILFVKTGKKSGNKTSPAPTKQNKIISNRRIRDIRSAETQIFHASVEQ